MFIVVRCALLSSMKTERIRSMSWMWATSGIFRRGKHIRSKVRRSGQESCRSC